MCDFNRLLLVETVRTVEEGRWHAADLLRPEQRVFAQPVHFLKPCHDEDDVGSAEPFPTATLWSHPKVAVIDGGFDIEFCPDEFWVCCRGLTMSCRRSSMPPARTERWWPS